VFAREGGMVLWWRLYAGGIRCGRYASLEEVHRGRIFRGVQKSSPRRATRAILPAAGAKLWLPPSAIPPKGPFRPGAEPVVDRGRPHRTPAWKNGETW